ncbi:helix-turn-helix domain-containing protein [Brevibacillus nitrificans]|uniref:helix-turn-helix domain-containing protein n=1 Tax=Brevibacillus nitrificans TaxID=651560 RepID=UPI002629424D|nr:XRE family transcriptional regulator [Brevibacillus nitrificans]MED1794796.1 XRE family transcriptional regulator [Brevibacillus nitrificans]
MNDIHQFELPIGVIGERIRSKRKDSRLTVDEVAEKIGLSQSMVSQLERGKAKPSLDTLWKLSIIFDVPLSYFFEGIKKNSVFVSRREEQEILTMRHSNVQYRVLAPLTGTKIEFFEIIVSPDRGEEIPLFPHQGEEGGIVLQGQIEVILGDEKILLKQGDSIYFDSTKPHAFRNPGDTPAVAIWTGTPWVPIDEN